jgi:acetolactate synthase-1/2/3 large subunit
MFPMGWGTLGFSLPTAVGVTQAAAAPTVVLTGDAGLMFNVGELATIAERELPVVAVVFNDRAYAMLAYGMDEEHSSELRELGCPDILALARAFGIRAERSTLAALPARLREAVGAARPAVIEVPNLLVPPVSTGVRWPLRASRNARPAIATKSHPRSAEDVGVA